jgi:guanosine-3',5'-bis(diphosphate) 3'-pyrophosphohydrolase
MIPCGGTVPPRPPHPEDPITTTPLAGTTLLLRAARFAAERHAGQRRKDAARTPYINHCLAVAETLAVAGGVTDAEVLAAALLHDTVEDTPTRPDELRERFGARVCAIVAELTDDKRLEKSARKALQIEHAAASSPEAKLVKLGDKICNLADLAETPPADWSVERRREYFTWAERVVEGCRGVNAGLEARFDEVLYRGREALDASGRPPA